MQACRAKNINNIITERKTIDLWISITESEWETIIIWIVTHRQNRIGKTQRIGTDAIRPGINCTEANEYIQKRTSIHLDCECIFLDSEKSVRISWAKYCNISIWVWPSCIPSTLDHDVIVITHTHTAFLFLACMCDNSTFFVVLIDSKWFCAYIIIPSMIPYYQWCITLLPLLAQRIYKWNNRR